MVCENFNNSDHPVNISFGTFGRSTRRIHHFGQSVDSSSKSEMKIESAGTTRHFTEK